MLYLDLDGVFADFDIGVERVLGTPMTDMNDEAMWQRLRQIPNFYRELPLITEAPVLWDAFRPYDPIFLTGIPRDQREMHLASKNKLEWVAKHFDDAPVITCLSREKARYCVPGDVLLDDRIRYRKPWESAGGIFIQHFRGKSEDSIRLVEEALEEAQA